ncbi:MAG: hypothetical protein Q9163_000246 [Psora crenata]
MAPERVVVPHDPDAPLDPSLRSELFTALIRQNAISDLQKTLEAECQSAGWQDRVQERILQLLRNGEVKSLKRLEAIIVAEALGREKGAKGISDAEVDGAGQVDDEDATREKRTLEHRETNGGSAADIKLPEKATIAGTEIVRAVLEDVVDVGPVEEEVPVWRDWR